MDFTLAFNYRYVIKKLRRILCIRILLGKNIVLLFHEISLRGLYGNLQTTCMVTYTLWGSTAT